MYRLDEETEGGVGRGRSRGAMSVAKYQASCRLPLNRSFKQQISRPAPSLQTIVPSNSTENSKPSSPSDAALASVMHNSRPTQLKIKLPRGEIRGIATDSVCSDSEGGRKK